MAPEVDPDPELPPAALDVPDEELELELVLPGVEFVPVPDEFEPHAPPAMGIAMKTAIEVAERLMVQAPCSWTASIDPRGDPAALRTRRAVMTARSLR